MFLTTNGDSLRLYLSFYFYSFSLGSVSVFLKNIYDDDLTLRGVNYLLLWLLLLLPKT